MILDWHRNNELPKRLDAVAGVGPITATTHDPRATIEATRIFEPMDVIKDAPPLLPGLPASEYPIREVFRLDHHGNAVDLLPGDYDIVLLVWPNRETQFAQNVACAMRPGQTLIYEGESEGGCTADRAFFQYLRNFFDPNVAEMEALNENHRTFPGVHDKWWVGIKR